jgi:meso-butanediol dehydrogenase / (S,S)-butanediol dehydrogenase / diacetyl reductase
MSLDSRKDLADIVMVITGAGRGIGKEISKISSLVGAKVAMLDINESNLTKSVAEISALGGDVKGFLVDLTSESQVNATIDKIANEYGRIDCLVNNAMAIGAEDLLSTSLEDWEFQIKVTLTGAFLCIKRVLPGMMALGAGNIINIGTVNAKEMLGSDAYSAAKAGLHALTRSVAVRYGPSGIRCNTVVPGSIATEVWLQRAERNPQVFEDLKPWYPLGRVGKPSDIAEAVVFLASSRSQWMSGSEMVVDGGLLAGPAPMHKIIEASE